MKSSETMDLTTNESNLKYSHGNKTRDITFINNSYDILEIGLMHKY